MTVRLMCLLCLSAFMLFSSAWASSDCKIAIHLLPHANMGCNRLPGIPSCMDFEYTHDFCEDVDVFPVLYDISGVTAIDIGLTWPETWGSCAFTACGFDLQMYGIQWPGDFVVGSWSECQHVRSVVVGFGWLGPTSAGLICPLASPDRDFVVMTDCDMQHFQASAIFCAGVCGAQGDDPCGGGTSEDKTWGAIKTMYR